MAPGIRAINGKKGGTNRHLSKPVVFRTWKQKMLISMSLHVLGKWSANEVGHSWGEQLVRMKHGMSFGKTGVNVPAGMTVGSFLVSHISSFVIGEFWENVYRKSMPFSLEHVPGMMEYLPIDVYYLCNRMGLLDLMYLLLSLDYSNDISIDDFYGILIVH